MKLLLPPQVLKRLRKEMRRAKKREIGGLLLGEHIGGETFRLVDVTVQRTGGSSGHFVRDPSQHQPQLDDFFTKTGRDFTRYNYLGEWHTHPSFEPLPSPTDISTMQQIVEDPEVGANFLVLVIARMGSQRSVQISACLFRPYLARADVELAIEATVVVENRLMKAFRWIKQLIEG